MVGRLRSTHTLPAAADVAVIAESRRFERSGLRWCAGDDALAACVSRPSGALMQDPGVSLLLGRERGACFDTSAARDGHLSGPPGRA